MAVPVRRSRQHRPHGSPLAPERLQGRLRVEVRIPTAPGLNMMTHPMLMEALVRFQANAITEIFPATGPAKSKILGTQTRAKKEQANRIEMFVNYYLTEVDREYFADTDQMLLYVGMAGSVFRKGGQNWITGMPEMRYVKATNFIAPYSGTDLKSMPRYCHEFTMSGDDIKRAIATGMFTDIRLPKSNSNATHAPSADTADSRVNVMHDDDALCTIQEWHIDLELDYRRSRNVAPVALIAREHGPVAPISDSCSSSMSVPPTCASCLTPSRTKRSSCAYIWPSRSAECVAFDLALEKH
jgi:hypothetical protein